MRVPIVMMFCLSYARWILLTHQRIGFDYFSRECVGFLGLLQPSLLSKNPEASINALLVNDS
jgi:hypothetical protein